MKTAQLTDVRKQIKPLGYTVKTKSYSEFTAAYLTESGTNCEISGVLSEFHFEKHSKAIAIWQSFDRLENKGEKLVTNKILKFVVKPENVEVIHSVKSLL